MVLIEFTGLPGSGKSTTMALLVQELERQNVTHVALDEVIMRKVRKDPHVGALARLLPEKLAVQFAVYWFKIRNYKHFYQVQFCKTRPELVAHYNKYNNSRRISEKDKEKVYDWFIATGGRYQMAAELCQDHEVFVVDEGFFHRSINLFVGAPEEIPDVGAIQKYLELIPHVDLLCEIKVSQSAAFERVICRGKPERFQHVKDDEFMAIMKDSTTILDQGLSFFRGRTIQIDNIAHGKSSSEINQEISKRLMRVDFAELTSKCQEVDQLTLIQQDRSQTCSDQLAKHECSCTGLEHDEEEK